MDIQVIEMRIIDNGKPLKAFVDMQIGNMTIRDFRIIQNDGHRAYLTCPQMTYRGKDGMRVVSMISSS